MALLFMPRSRVPSARLRVSNSPPEYTAFKRIRDAFGNRHDIHSDVVHLQSGRSIRAPTVIVAVDGPAAARLLDSLVPQDRGTRTTWTNTRCQV